MFKRIFLIIIALVIVGVAGYWLYQPENAGVEFVFNPKNAVYTIEGDSITLINGKAEKEIPGSASKIEVLAWGEPSIGDLNADNVNDAALIVTYSAGGSGMFYYVAAALQDARSGKTVGTNAILLGDRIAPQNISIDSGKITVNYADRKQGEPFAVQPSVGITRYFEVQDSVLTEVTEDWAKKEQACILSGGIFDGNKCLETTFCQPQQRQGDVCFQLYDPVCAKVNIQCVKAPCNPVNQTFSNPCEACRNPLVESYARGECTNQ